MDLEQKDVARLTVDGQIVYHRPGEVIAIGEAAKRFVRDELMALHPDEPRGHRPAATLPRHVPDGREAEHRATLARALDRARDVLAAAIDREATHESLEDIRAALDEVDRALESLAGETDGIPDLISGSREAVDAIASDGEQADAHARDARARLEGAGAELDRLSPLVVSLPPAFRFAGLNDPETLVVAARSRGLRVQLNHVFYSHTGCGCGCDPCCAGNPYGAFPYKATPYKATPYKATPYKATAPARTSAEVTAAPPSGLHEAAELAQAAIAAEEAAAAGGGVEAAEWPPANVWILDTGTSDLATPLTPVVQRNAHDLMSGQQGDHPNRWPEAPRQPDDLVDPVAGHGTFIAGIVTELAPGTRIWISRLMRPTGDLEEWEVADEIHRLLQSPPTGHEDLKRTILNLSFGGALHSACNPLVGEAIAAAQEAGVVVVASAGNEASCLPVYPGNFPGVVAVGALDHDGDPASFTNRGTWVDACALGVDIVSTFFDFTGVAALDTVQPSFAGWAIWSGTSFATPVVAALIASEMTGSDLSAADARDAVIGRGTLVPCLGVRVHDEDKVPRLQAAAASMQPDSSRLRAFVDRWLRRPLPEG